MCTSRGMWCALLSLLLPCLWSPVGPAFAETGPGLGVPLDQDTIRRLDFTVLPDGTGLPDGGGSADRGEVLFQQLPFFPASRTTGGWFQPREVPSSVCRTLRLFGRSCRVRPV